MGQIHCPIKPLYVIEKIHEHFNAGVSCLLR